MTDELIEAARLGLVALRESVDYIQGAIDEYDLRPERDPYGRRRAAIHMLLTDHQDAIASLTRALTSPELSKWKLVPVEPTEYMIREGLDCQDADPGDSSETELYWQYKAMLDAAPQPPSIGQVLDGGPKNTQILGEN